MKEIDKCSIIPQELETYLFKNGYINYCGGNGGFNFTRFFENNIEVLKDYLPNKGDILIKDISRLCATHDLLYLILKGNTNFYYANFLFVKDLAKLLNWVGFIKKYVILITILIMLNKHGKEYYKK